MRRLLRLVVIVLCLGVAGTLAAAAALVWRLQRGPVSIDFLVPRIAAELAAGEGQWRVTVDGLDLVWAVAAHQVELRAHGLRIAKANGEGQVSLEAARIRLRRRALLRGEIDVIALELDAPVLQLVRDRAGRLGMQVGTPSEGTQDLGWLDHVLRRLEHVAVHDGQITFIDEQSQTRWSLPQVDGDAWQSGGPIQVRVGLAMGSQASPIPVWIEGTYRPGAGTLVLVASSPGAAVGPAFAEWPASLVPEAHAWVTSHLKEGRVRDVRLECTGHVVRDGARRVAIDTVDARVAFDGLAVRYLDTMPPATDVAGTARFTRDDVTVTIDRGTLDALVVGPATVRVAWPANARNHLAVDVTTRGPLASLIAVLDHEPVALGQRAIFQSRGLAGVATSRVRLAFPLGGRVVLGQLGLHATATISGATAPYVAGDWDVANGNATVVVNDRAMEVRGTGDLRGVPVAVHYESRLGSGTASRLVVTGRLDDAARERLGMATAPAITGPVDVVARFTPSADGRVAAAVEVDLGPAAVDVRALALHKEVGEPGRVAARASLVRGTAMAIEQVEATAGAVTVRGAARRAPGGGAWDRVDGTVSFAIPDRPDDPALLEFGLRARERRWQTTIASRNFGLVLRAYGYEHGRGGRMTFAGTTELPGADVPLEGQLTIESLTLLRVPWLLKVASLASIRGLLDVGSEPVVSISRFVATVAHRTASTIEVRDGVGQGSKLGGTVSGTIDFAADTLDLEGTLVPSYYLLNQGADRIPVLGALMNRATGGAIQAVSFKARGPRADPAVTVQPLSSLAPGVVRDWLRKLGL